MEQLLSFFAGAGGQVGIYGPAGFGKTFALNRIAEDGECRGGIRRRVELDGRDNSFGFKLRKADNNQWGRYFTSTAVSLQQKPERSIGILNSLGEQLRGFLSLLYEGADEQAVMHSGTNTFRRRPQSRRAQAMFAELSQGEKRRAAMV